MDGLAGFNNPPVATLPNTGGRSPPTHHKPKGRQSHTHVTQAGGPADCTMLCTPLGFASLSPPPRASRSALRLFLVVVWWRARLHRVTRKAGPV